MDSSEHMAEALNARGENVTTEDFLERWKAEESPAQRNAMLREYLLTLGSLPALERTATIDAIAEGCKLKISVLKAQIKELTRPPKKQRSTAEWASQLMYKDTGNGVELLAHIENLRVIFTYHPAIEGRITYNEFTNQIDITEPIELHDGIILGEKRRTWTESEETDFRAWLNRVVGIDPKVADLGAAIKKAADRQSYHPVREYLLSLPQWDGAKRLPFVFERYFGTTRGERPEDQSKRVHNSLAGWYWFQSLIARVMPGRIEGRFERPDADREGACGPGCFVKYLIVLEGPQSLMKSRAMKAFVPSQAWYAGSDLPLDNEKKLGELLAGKWIVEIKEFDRVMKHHPGQIKAAVDRENDSYRPAYARGTAVANPRHNVFLATVNPYEYFVDNSGNVRFWPIACGVVNGDPESFQIDCRGLERDAKQILAEAFHAYAHGWQDDNTNTDCPFFDPESAARGEATHLCWRWWPTPTEERTIFKTEQSARMQELANERPIMSWLSDPTFPEMVEWSDTSVIPTDIVTRSVLRTNDPVQITALKSQVEGVLARAGWIKGSHWSGKLQRTVRGWKRPTSHTPVASENDGYLDAVVEQTSLFS